MLILFALSRCVRASLATSYFIITSMTTANDSFAYQDDLEAHLSYLPEWVWRYKRRYIRLALVYLHSILTVVHSVSKYLSHRHKGANYS